MSISSGVVTLANWLGEGGKPVDSQTSEFRAGVCKQCRHNQKVNWKSLFKEGIADAVLAYERLRRSEKLSTSHDPSLGECDVCGCILKLKVHVPLGTITAHMAPGEFGETPDYCWIKMEVFRERDPK